MDKLSLSFKNCIKLMLAIMMISFGFTSSVYADDDTIEMKDKEWQFTLAPLYVWWLGMDGDSTVSLPDNGRDKTFPLSASDLSGAFSVHLEANKDRWTFFTDYLYAEYTTDISTGPGGRIKGENQLRVKLFEVGEAYRVLETAYFDVEVLGGLRHLHVEDKLSFDNLLPTIEASGSVLDGFAGGRITGRVTDSINAHARGDIGTGQTKFLWNVMLGMDWQYKDWGSVYAGYRWLSYEFEKEKTGNDLGVNLKATGPVIGLIFNW